MDHLPLIEKKPLRALGLFIVMLLSVTAFTSCEPEDDDFFYYNIIGRWIEVAPYDDEIYDFYGDGTGECFYADGTSSYFEWEADNYYLTLYFTNGYDESVEYYSWSFQGNSLYLYPNYDTSNPLVLKPY